MSLGKLTSISEFLSSAAATDRPRALSADDYRAQFLRQDCEKETERPISRWVAYWRCHQSLESARSMAALAACVGTRSSRAATRELLAEIEAANVELALTDGVAIRPEFQIAVDALIERATQQLAADITGDAIEQPNRNALIALNPLSSNTENEPLN